MINRKGNKTTAKRNLRDVVPRKFGMELEEFLRKRYWDEGMFQKDIAKELDVSRGMISRWFSKLNINTRPMSHWHVGRKVSPKTIEAVKRTHTGKVVSAETRRKISEARKGQKIVGKSPHFPGRRNRSDGYIQIYKPSHPRAASDGYVMEHRLIMEEVLGRYLEPSEEVHHINGNKKDNRSENLHLFSSKRDHMKFHMYQRHGKTKELKYEY